MMPRLPHKTCPKASRHLLRGGGRGPTYKAIGLIPRGPKRPSEKVPLPYSPSRFLYGLRKKRVGRKEIKQRREAQQREEGGGGSAAEEEEEDRGWLPPKERGESLLGCLPSSRGSPRGTNVVKLNLLDPSSPILSRQQ